MRRFAPYLAAALLVGLGALLWYLWPAEGPRNANTPVSNSNATNAPVNQPALPAMQTLRAEDVPGADPMLRFTAEVPETWGVEAVPGSQALNLYDPAAPGDSNLDRSQVFVRFFRATGFLTLSTVEVRSRTETTVNGRPAVTYVIEKKAGVTDFPDQPSWRNREHRVTDIRSSDEATTTFYVFAQNPALDSATFEAILASVRFGAPLEPAAVHPMTDFAGRITKKRFGQYITRANSPVQPERFSGYHTAVDLETTAAEQSADVPVYAVAAGTVRVRRTADGYGGVVLIEHTVRGETVTAVYGHLRLTSVAKQVGETVTLGERIGVLGTGGTSETDGERKHLHFGVLKGASTALAGYVSSESALSAWYDPVAWLAGWEAVPPTE